MRVDEAGNEVPSTLGEYRDLVEAIVGKGKATAFLDQKIQASPHGRDEIVLAHDWQMRELLFPLMAQDVPVEITVVIEGVFPMAIRRHFEN